jgi:hypothetical protein
MCVCDGRRGGWGYAEDGIIDDGGRRAYLGAWLGGPPEFQDLGGKGVSSI